jgi:amidase
MMTELWRLSATEAVAKLRKRELSPLELVDAAASRIEAVEPKVNALPIRFFDEARDHAKRFGRESRHNPGWLAGLPMAVKDYNDVAGQLTTYGSPIFAEYRAPADDRTIATLRANGAIPLAKSNVPEFAGSHTFNPVWGTTRNPWNLGRTAGGSSGGAAAALAAGEVWIANGSCLGGSLRIPASFCGIVGLRPSPGVVPRGDGLPAFDSLWVDGPMARNVADLALMLDAMAVLTQHDPLSRPVPEGGFQAALQRARPPRRIGFSPNLGLRSIDPEVARMCRAGAQRFTEMGCVVEERAPDFSGAIFHRVAKFFDNYDLLVCPTVAVSPFPVEQRFPIEIAGEKLITYIDWMFLTFVITLVGCPAISLPCGLTHDGLPVGLQLVGRPHGDAELLGTAFLLEQALGFDRRVPLEV